MFENYMLILCNAGVMCLVMCIVYARASMPKNQPAAFWINFSGGGNMEERVVAVVEWSCWWARMYAQVK